MPPPAPCVADAPDVLLEDIFLRLPAAADLARASATCPSFRRVIAGHAFLRRYRALHPPPLIAILHDHIPFVPAQPPHPAAVAARAFAGFDFSCSSFLPLCATIRYLDDYTLVSHHHCVRQLYEAMLMLCRKRSWFLGPRCGLGREGDSWIRCIRLFNAWYSSRRVGSLMRGSDVFACSMLMLCCKL